jgi:hypothetical protein
MPRMTSPSHSLVCHLLRARLACVMVKWLAGVTAKGPTCVMAKGLAGVMANLPACANFGLPDPGLMRRGFEI